MTYAYDPQTPYVVVGKFSRNVIARFSYLTLAQDFGAPDDWEVIDTTPKPKIPEDAKHITWGSGATAYSRRPGGWVGGTFGVTISEARLLELIGDAEVTVLVPKEES